MAGSEKVLVGRLLDDDEKELFSQIRLLVQTFVEMVNDGRIKAQSEQGSGWKFVPCNAKELGVRYTN